MAQTRVQHFSISLDGFGTGEGLSQEAPFGHAGQKLHQWMFATRWGKTMFGQAGGTRGVDDAILRTFDVGIGAEIMGSNKFGYPGWQDDAGWDGWWGEDPPFHTPVFVMTRHKRAPLAMEGGTTFHFTDAPPAEVLAMAKEAAGGRDVRIGGGVRTLRAFLAEGLIDHMHLVQVPVVLGRGQRLWDGLEGIEQRYDIELTPSPSGVVHMMFTRKG
ncbi:dihydrofolate reductase family protein [Devosia sp. 63-57]|uniref:dihydrofolate reductase family protein n=1 Tax=Devosia sp. 63-57 TaxID=1895751 RepID=UPI00086E50DC|nr:dihydrofolate reductase family protein [Devosia sp. 63-57]ODT50685.1 MAG: deaminase [Pelagibacterium sp. SCN 63-126]ODU88575.1 MAG: deaminase [Pelagibacterium sp. SCN 63-17]OJX45817.1 MAG: deaminase [Devosia sp. 63-57]